MAWATGLYVLDVKEANDQLDLYDGAVDRALVSHYAATSLAAYGQVQWRFSSSWSLQVGARAEQRQAEYRDTDAGDFAPRDRMLGGNASLEYRLDAARKAYLTLSRGYKAGGFNIGAAVPAGRREFAPELLTSIEAGYKQSAADDRLEGQASLFYMRRRDQQVSTSAQLDPADPLTFIYLTDNAARGENRGAELSLAWRASDALRVGATAGWLSTRYIGYMIGQRSLDGRSQSHAPARQFSVSAEYRAAGGWFARADAAHVASFYFSESHDQRSRPYTLANLRLGYASRNWEASVWARNLFDAGYTQRGFFFGNEPPDFPDKLYVQPCDPRQLGATLRIDLR
jgi:outer membrane receptor protein involved in Fe transport